MWSCNRSRLRAKRGPLSTRGWMRQPIGTVGWDSDSPSYCRDEKECAAMLAAGMHTATSCELSALATNARNSITGKTETPITVRTCQSRCNKTATPFVLTPSTMTSILQTTTRLIPSTTMLKEGDDRENPTKHPHQMQKQCEGATRRHWRTRKIQRTDKCLDRATDETGKRHGSAVGERQ